MKSCGVRIRGFSWPPTQNFFFEQLLASQTHFKVPRISDIPLAADELCFLGFRSEYVCQCSKLQKHPSSNCYPQFLLVTFESPLNHEDVCLSKLALYELLTNPSRFAVNFLHGSTCPLRFVDSPLSSCSWQMTSQTVWDTLLPNKQPTDRLGNHLSQNSCGGIVGQSNMVQA